MANPEILSHSVKVEEEEVFDLIHIAREVIEPQASKFTGRVAEWADERERRGDNVIPILTYEENGHRVSFVLHEGRDEEGTPYCTRHIVCDCATGIIDQDSPIRIVEQIVTCEKVQRALQRRGAYVDYKYKTTEILSALRNPNEGDFGQPNEFHRFALKSIGNLLELDIRHPNEWPANIIGGQHQVSIVSTMFQLHPEVVKWYGSMLEEEGYITDYDGETLKLNPQALAA